MAERKQISQAQWKIIKAQWNNRCVLCGRTEKQVGILVQAHIKAFSRGGSDQRIPLCLNDHYRFDHRSLTLAELKKLGILDRKTYLKLVPRKTKKKDWLFDL